MKAKQIWYVNLNPTQGAEIKKTRPALIVNDDSQGALPLRIIIPISEWNERYASADWHVKITPDTQNNLTKDSTADCFQIRSVSIQRFTTQMGEIDNDTYERIKKGIRATLNL